MDRLKSLEVFKTVADKGSFVRGAEALNLSNSVTTRAVQDLESLLGVRLFQRTTRRIALTVEGRSVLDQAVGILERYDQLAASSSLAATEAAGEIRLHAPVAYGMRCLGPALARFGAEHPRVRVDLKLSDAEPDLVGDGVDLALLVGRDPGLSAIARPVGYVEMGIYASRDYLARHGVPAEPSDLQKHASLTLGGTAHSSRWTLRRNDSSDTQEVAVRGVLQSNNADAILTAVSHGMGIALLPRLFCEASVARGELHTVLDDWFAPTQEVQLVYSSRRNLPMRVRLLIDRLVEDLAPVFGPMPKILRH
jgi:LysR family transcriptional regulator, regulator for bpeEF and oprC